MTSKWGVFETAVSEEVR